MKHDNGRSNGNPFNGDVIVECDGFMTTSKQHPDVWSPCSVNDLKNFYNYVKENGKWCIDRLG